MRFLVYQLVIITTLCSYLPDPKVKNLAKSGSVFKIEIQQVSDHFHINIRLFPMNLNFIVNFDFGFSFFCFFSTYYILLLLFYYLLQKFFQNSIYAMPTKYFVNVCLFKILMSRSID